MDSTADRQNLLVPEMATIPAGPFTMGSDDGDEDERPPHVVDLAAFQIGVQPVINAEYARFVRESGHRPPNVHALPLVVTAGNSEREDVFRRTSETYAWHGGAPPRERLDHPVTMVQWDDAVAYCAWLSAATGRAFRLPTEAEWEKTCRGGLRGQRYPWGERFDQAMVRFLEEPANRAKHGTMPCRAYPAERLRRLRHRRKRLGMGAGLVCARRLRGAAALEPGRAGEWTSAHRPRRRLAVGGRPHAEVLSSPQGAA